MGAPEMFDAEGEWVVGAHVLECDVGAVVGELLVDCVGARRTASRVGGPTRLARDRAFLTGALERGSCGALRKTCLQLESKRRDVRPRPAPKAAQPR